MLLGTFKGIKSSVGSVNGFITDRLSALTDMRTERVSFAVPSVILQWENPENSQVQSLSQADPQAAFLSCRFREAKPATDGFIKISIPVDIRNHGAEGQNSRRLWLLILPSSIRSLKFRIGPFGLTSMGRNAICMHFQLDEKVQFVVPELAAVPLQYNTPQTRHILDGLASLANATEFKLYMPSPNISRGTLKTFCNYFPQPAPPEFSPEVHLAAICSIDGNKVIDMTKEPCIESMPEQDRDRAGPLMLITPEAEPVANKLNVSCATTVENSHLITDRPRKRMRMDDGNEDECIEVETIQSNLTTTIRELRLLGDKVEMINRNVLTEQKARITLVNSCKEIQKRQQEAIGSITQVHKASCLLHDKQAKLYDKCKDIVDKEEEYSLPEIPRSRVQVVRRKF